MPRRGTSRQEWPHAVAAGAPPPSPQLHQKHPCRDPAKRRACGTSANRISLLRHLPCRSSLRSRPEGGEAVRAVPTATGTGEFGAAVPKQRKAVARFREGVSETPRKVGLLLHLITEARKGNAAVSPDPWYVCFAGVVVVIVVILPLYLVARSRALPSGVRLLLLWVPVSSLATITCVFVALSWALADTPISPQAAIAFALAALCGLGDWPQSSVVYVCSAPSALQS